MSENLPAVSGAKEDSDRKTVESFVASLVLQDPSFQGRATVAAIYGFLQMPDSGFGWSLEKSMGWHTKLMVIAATLKLGLEVGVGHVLWLGNKVYITAAAARFLAAGDPNWKVIGEPIYRALTPDERAMFCLEDGDMACAAVQEIEAKGVRFRAIGHGIIGADELAKRDSRGLPLPGRGSKKDLAMTLKTRAERDLLNRFYSVRGMPIAEPEDYETIEAQARPIGPSPEATTVKAANAPVPGAAQQAAIKALNDAVQRAGIGIEAIEEQLGMSLGETAKLSADEIYNAIDVIEDLSEIVKKPKRGRPPKKPEPAPMAPIEPQARPGEKAYAAIGRLKAAGPNAAILECLVALEATELREGDEVEIAAGCRQAVSGDLSGLDGLIKARGGRAPA